MPLTDPPMTDPPLPARRAPRPALVRLDGDRRRAAVTDTVPAARHPYGGPVDVEVGPVTGHEGGRGHHQPRKLARLTRTWA